MWTALTKKNRMTIVGPNTHRVGFDHLLFLPAGPLTHDAVSEGMVISDFQMNRATQSAM